MSEFILFTAHNSEFIKTMNDIGNYSFPGQPASNTDSSHTHIHIETNNSTEILKELDAVK